MSEFNIIIILITSVLNKAVRMRSGVGLQRTNRIILIRYVLWYTYTYVRGFEVEFFLAHILKTFLLLIHNSSAVIISHYQGRCNICVFVSLNRHFRSISKYPFNTAMQQLSTLWPYIKILSQCSKMRTNQSLDFLLCGRSLLPPLSLSKSRHRL